MKDLQVAANQRELKQRLQHIQQMLSRSCQTSVNLFTTEQDLFAGTPAAKLMLTTLLQQL